MAEETKGKDNSEFGKPTVTTSNWSARVDWAKVAEDLQPVEELIADKIQQGRDRRQARAEEEGYADAKSFRKGRKAEEAKADAEEAEEGSRKQERKQKKYEKKAGKANLLEGGTLLNPKKEEDSPNNFNLSNLFPLLKDKNKKKNSPFNFGSADPNLVSMFRRTSQAMYGSTGMSEARKQIDAVQAAYKKKIAEAAQIELEEYDIAKADSGFKDFGNGGAESQAWLEEKKSELAALKNEAAKIGYRGKKYKALKEKMQVIEDETNALNSSMRQVQDAKLEWVETNGYGPKGNGIDTYSNGSNETNRNYLNQIFSKNAQMIIDKEDGNAVKFNVTDSNGEIVQVRLQDITKDVYKKDVKGRENIRKYKDKMKTVVSGNLDYDVDQTNADLEFMLEGASPAKLMSWMHDDILGTGKSFVESYAKFNKDLVEAYPDAFKVNSGIWNKVIDQENQKTFGDFMKEEMIEFYQRGIQQTYNKYQKASDNKGSESEVTSSFDSFAQYLENTEGE